MDTPGRFIGIFNKRNPSLVNASEIYSGVVECLGVGDNQFRSFFQQPFANVNGRAFACITGVGFKRKP